MTESRLASVETPNLDHELAVEATRLVSRVAAMGLGEGEPAYPVTRGELDATLRALAEAGIGRRLELAASDGELLLRLRLANDLVLESPHPKTEWVAVPGVLGAELASTLVGISASSMRRYAAEERVTPTDAADRLHFLAMVIADLAGSYTAYGIRRWFERRRTLLDGAAPRDLLTDGWLSDDPGAQRVAQLARALTGLGAT